MSQRAVLRGAGSLAPNPSVHLRPSAAHSNQLRTFIITNRRGYPSSQKQTLLITLLMITPDNQVVSYQAVQKTEMVQLGLQTLCNDILEYKPPQGDHHMQSGTVLMKMLPREIHWLLITSEFILIQRKTNTYLAFCVVGNTSR